MSDIVERLRAQFHTMSSKDYVLMRQAADKIEKLRAEVERLKRMNELGITEQDIAETMPPVGER